MDIMDIISLTLAIVSIVLGIYAIYQADKYNKQSDEIFSDIKYLITRQIAVVDNINYEKEKNKPKPKGVVCLKKDKIHFHKLSSFDKTDIVNIMEEVEKLSIKSRFLGSIADFLYSDKQEDIISFRGYACKANNEEIDFLALYEVFLQYNISIYIN